MRKLLCCAASTAALLLVANAADTVAPRKRVPSAAANTKSARKTAPAAALHKSTGAHKALPSRPATTWRNRQVAPTTDRYREIQEALAAKGYLQPEEASGKWDQNSVAALKKFQAEQKLDSTGKINSLSLIALGLGPKYEPPAPVKTASELPPGQR